jgi:hypothetical protein
MQRMLAVLFMLCAIKIVAGQTDVTRLSRPSDTELRDAALSTSRGEASLNRQLRDERPLAEIYVQYFDEGVPILDERLLGELRVDTKGPRLLALETDKPSTSRTNTKRQSDPYLPDGFAMLIAPVWPAVDPARYSFVFVKDEPVSAIRCLVFDVRPIDGGRGGFRGRIWVEPRESHIVRFSGTNSETDRALSTYFNRKSSSFRVDGYRMQVGEDRWKPSYFYVEETDPHDRTPQPLIKIQMRLWGYDRSEDSYSTPFAAIVLDPATTIDRSEPVRVPVLDGQRQWEDQAVVNILARLLKGRFIAPPGEVEDELNIILNKLIASNKVDVDGPVQCLLLTTGRLEAFTLGRRTILISVGMVDAAPDSASIATVIAHQLAHIVLGHTAIDTKYAFPDRLMVADVELLRELRFSYTREQEIAADKRGLELLKGSTYAASLKVAGLFQREVSSAASRLRALVEPILGRHVADADGVVGLSLLMRGVPAKDPHLLTQIVALPLGARVALHPLDGRAELVQLSNAPIRAEREKAPLSIVHLSPLIQYVDGPLQAASLARSAN